jgi:hypothetical protein
MGRLTRKLTRNALGAHDAREEGLRRALGGLRRGDQRQLYLGLALSALAYLSRTKPRRQLLYRKTVPVGSAIVVQHREKGDPHIEVIKP